MKLYIIANRLPVRAVAQKDKYTFVRSEGGLATGLDSLEMNCDKHWIGWPGVCVDSPDVQHDITAQLAGMQFHPVFLTQSQYQDYYEGYSNSTLWPLCHYFYSYTHVKKDFWESYQEVNRLFCDEICRQVSPDDWVWVNDYQLMLLPGMLRKRMPHLHIGYFHHIPFPSYELFRILPERADLLQGLLGADFIAFHTHDYVRHFISATQRVMHVTFNLDEVQLDHRSVRVEALPMGINYNLYHQAIVDPKVKQQVEKNHILFGHHRLLLSVDRLDYSKGITHRLQGYRRFLEQHPEYHGKVTLAMVIVPSRDHVGSYADLKTRIDETIGAINGQYSTINWTPVCYFYHSFSFEELAALYYTADVALVTPLRDGMNLVAKEYIATKNNNPGVLVLSEMAGAAVEMNGALLINPNDIDQIAQSIHQALVMPVQEQMDRINRMQSVISQQTVHQWAASFMNEWKEVIDRNTYFTSKRMTANKVAQIHDLYQQTHRRLLLLDYDGTLAAFADRPQEASPTPQLLHFLEQLCADPNNHVVINSGRDRLTLEQWLGHLRLDFAAEHGASYREHGVWHTPANPVTWTEGLMSILRMFVAKTPHSHIEQKATTIVWHYREVDPWLGELRAQQLVRALVSICLQQNLQVMQGNKVVEIKSPAYSKGTEVRRLLQHDSYDFILAIGDDTTDEDMFVQLPSKAVTVKVGKTSELARYNLPLQSDVLPFLQQLISGHEPRKASPAIRGKGFFQRLKNLLG